MMESKKILEGNTLIAFYMGYTWSDEKDGNTYIKESPNQKNIYSIQPFHLSYHRSWDKIIPACIKFRSMTDYDTFVDEKYNRSPYFAQRVSDLIESVSTMDIELVFNQLVVCIQWHNHKTANNK